LISRLQNRQIISGHLFAIGATALWAGNFIIARGLSDSISPINLVFLQVGCCRNCVLPFALRPLISEWDILKENIPYLSITSLLGITIFNTLIYLAGHMTTAINLSLISISFPVFIVIFSRIFFGERITPNKGFGIILVIIGVITLISKGDFSRLLNISFAIGDVWMLMAAIIFAIYSILIKYKPEKLSIWAFQLSTFILGLIFLFPFFIWEYVAAPPVKFDTKTVCSILYVGIFASLSAFVLWNKAVMMVGPSKAGMIYYILPLFSGGLAYLFLKEGISIIHFYSMLLIVSGIFTANYESKKSTPVLHPD